MKKIPLTHGKFALVDDEDFDQLIKYKWHLYDGYARRSARTIHGKRLTILMHRVICSTPSGLQTDHINCDRLDNRRKNLRVVTAAENKCNCGKRRSNTSGFKGVGFSKKTGWFEAQIQARGEKMHLGSFATAEEAHVAYCNEALRVHGAYGRTA